MSSLPSAALRAVLTAWPGGVDVVPAAALDPYVFTTVRAVVIALDAPLDRALLLAHYPADIVAGAERDATNGFLVLPPRDPFADLASLGTIARIAARLRAADGCPWDREQTHASLRPHLLEEAHEALEALDHGDLPTLKDELGDLLFQIAIHAQLASEEGAFDLADVSRAVGEKLVRRHPHVFAGTSLDGTDLLVQWEQIKRREKRERQEQQEKQAKPEEREQREQLESHALPSPPDRPGAPDGAGRLSVLDGIPKTLPALFAAERLQERAARVKLVPPRVQLPLDVDDQSFLGELLFDLVAEARDRGFDAETALREANERFATHVRRVEERARRESRELESYSDADMRALWEATGDEVPAA